MSALQDRANLRAGARGLTRNSHGALIRKLSRVVAGGVCAAAVAVPIAAVVAAQAATAAPVPLTTTWNGLTLQNGWFDYGNGMVAPAATNISGIGHLKGAIATHGTDELAFTLPAGDRPTNEVYLPEDMAGANPGRLDILPDGAVYVEAGASWSHAQQATSLDGASFAMSETSFTELNLKNGWTKYGFSSPSPAVRNVGGVVHLERAIATGGSTQWHSPCRLGSGRATQSGCPSICTKPTRATYASCPTAG